MKTAALLAVVMVLLVFNVCPTRAELDISAAYQDSYRYEKTGNYLDAIRALVPVYKVYPDTYTLNYRLGWLFYLLQKYQDAEKYYQQAETLAPYSLEVKNSLAMLSLAREEWKKAEQYCNQVLTIDYYNFYGNLNLITALKAQKKYQDCESVARKMLYILPTNLSFLNELGISQFEQGLVEDANRIFNSVLILDPENVTAKHFLTN